MEIRVIQKKFQNSFQIFLNFNLCISFLFLSFLSSFLSLFFHFSLLSFLSSLLSLFLHLLLSFPSLSYSLITVPSCCYLSDLLPLLFSLLYYPLLSFSFLLTPSSSSPHLPIDHSIGFIVFSSLPAFSHFPSHSHCSLRFC